jgi:glycosyltransferase 2 family protein
MSDGKLGRLLRWLQPLFLLIAAGFIFYLLQSHWSELRAYPWRLQPAWFGLACVLLLASWWLEIVIWRRLLDAFGGRLGLADTLRIWFIAAIVRYIPGNVWQPLSLTLMCHRRGVRPEATLASIALFQIVTLIGTFPIAALYFIFVPVAQRPGFLDALPGAVAAALLLVPLLIFVVNPEWLMSILNWMLRKARRGEIPGKLTRRRLVTLLLVALVDWVLWGATFAALAFSLGEYLPAEMQTLAPHLVAIYPIAYAVGFISFVTPSGFGVREGALMVLLSPHLALPVITVIALAMRIWTMIGELILAAIVYLAKGSELIQKGGDQDTTLSAGTNSVSAAFPANTIPQTTDDSRKVDAFLGDTSLENTSLEDTNVGNAGDVSGLTRRVL